MERKQILLLGAASALSLAGYLAASYFMEGVGFPLDDAWIHQTYARNLARGAGWSFLPGQPSAGLTAPLWALMLAVGPALGLGPYAFTFTLGWLTLWGLAVLAGLAVERLVSKKNAWQPKAGWGLWAGLLVCFEWHLVWAAASGMETALFAALMLGGLVWLMGEAGKPRRYAWLGLGALVGLSAWVRPEGITLWGPLGFVLVLGRFEGERLKNSAAALAGFGALFGAYLGFNRWLAGSWWPNTFYAKQAEYAALREFSLLSRLGQIFSLPLVGAGVLLLPGFIYMMKRAWEERDWAELSGGLWALGMLGLYAVRLPVTYQHGRYVIPAMAVYFVWGLAGLAAWVRPNVPKVGRRVLSRAWLVSLGMLALGFWVMGAGAFGRDVAVIEQEMVAAAQWVAQNSEPGDLIAAHDIGALGYFAERPLLDLAGLVSPEVIPFIRDEAALAAYMDANEPLYLMTFPAWYPELTQGLVPVFMTDGEMSPELGGENMAVYSWVVR